MSLAAWPATLPQYALEAGMSDALPRQKVETGRLDGPPKARQRHKNRARPVALAFWADATQVATFKSFYEDSLAGGVKAFTWTHPATFAAATFRFTGAPPDIRAVSPTLFSISVQLMQVA